jgi:molecular chaperone GrpE
MDEKELSEQVLPPETKDLEQQASGEPEILLDELSLEEQVEFLQSSLDEMTAKSEEYLDGWQRARAEFANYKKRVLKESTEIHQNSRGEVIKIYLDIFDDLNRALDEKPAQGDGMIWAEGIELIVQKLSNRLEAEGVKPMKPLGEEFDPNIHEALMQEESDEYESGRIIEVMQEGYWIGDKVLRPALVRVAA